jgi:dihydroorotate dehydrogenase
VVARTGADAVTVGAPPRSEAPTPQAAAEGAARSVAGRLYGPGTFDTALAAVREVAALRLGLPVIGAGGLYRLEAAREMLAAGAVAVQVDAAIWNQPRLLAEWTAALGKR